MRVLPETLLFQEFAVIVHVTKPLFAWDELDSSPTLATLEAIPNAPLLAALQARRHHGCDTVPVPVPVLWGVLLLAILRHPTTEACLDELRRNAPSPPARRHRE